MTNKPYKRYDKVACHMPSRPDIVKMVDTLNGVIYINLDAQQDANMIMYLSEYGTEYCYRGD